MILFYNLTPIICIYRKKVMLSEGQVVSVKTYTCHFITFFYQFMFQKSFFHVPNVISHYNILYLPQESMCLYNPCHPFTFYYS